MPINIENEERPGRTGCVGAGSPLLRGRWARPLQLVPEAPRERNCRLSLRERTFYPRTKNDCSGKLFSRGSLVPAPRIGVGDPGHDGRGDRVERQDELGRSAADGLAGHAEDDARRLVLGDRECAGLAHLEQAACSVVAHSGHDHPGRVGAGRLRRRAKEDLDAGSVPAHRWAFDQLDAIAGAGAADQAVDVAGDQERPTGADRFRVVVASATSISIRGSLSSRWANAVVNAGGMCCTITMPGVFVGNPASNCWRA